MPAIFIEPGTGVLTPGWVISSVVCGISTACARRDGAGSSWWLFAVALGEAGVAAGTEPIGVGFAWYQLSVDLPLAAAEFGITE
ncbi:MAG: hypothetical protein H7138_19360, partial [Myxococcales bacterium]|nr:hypothetical protein [Myxococcales bacterium]